MSRLTNIDPMFILIYSLESSANYEETDTKIVKIQYDFVDLSKER